MKVFLWRSQVHFVSFGTFNLELWDDAMAKFLPLTKKDVLYVGKSGPCLQPGCFCICKDTTVYNDLTVCRRLPVACALIGCPKLCCANPSAWAVSTSFLQP